MIDPTSNLLTLAEKRENQFSTMWEKIYSAAQPGAVYSTPVTVGNSTVIIASEIMAGGGFGSGLGFESPPASPQQSEETSQPAPSALSSSGGGGGGGGGSSGRPVAIISIGPDGVTIKPIVDVTKIVLAGVTVWGTMMMVLIRMRKAKNR
jgi:uncharacterized spore protein YtfJ